MVRVVGGGPAGAAAAIAALRWGEPVEIYEQSPTPRHKACGDFLPSETVRALERLGVLRDCTFARPAQITRVILHIGSCEKRLRLREPAWGLSRHRLDGILLDRAAALGASIIHEHRTPQGKDVDATGRRKPRAPHVNAFKAQFKDATRDTAELFFFWGGCIGICPVEEGKSTVCGLVGESTLRELDYQPDTLLAKRIRPLERLTDWILDGPVTASEEIVCPMSGPYLAGDALATVVPYTGTGVLCALLTGELAGLAAARGTTFEQYYRRAEDLLGWHLIAGNALSGGLETGWARILAPLIPAQWPFRLTRLRDRLPVS